MFESMRDRASVENICFSMSLRELKYLMDIIIFFLKDEFLISEDEEFQKSIKNQ